jgi:uncharacterized membrane protein
MLGSFILPWVHRSKIASLFSEIESLEQRLSRLESQPPKKIEPVTVATATPVAPAPSIPAAAAFPSASPLPPATPTPPSGSVPASTYKSTPVREERFVQTLVDLEEEEPETQKPANFIGFEQQFGARLPVWIGGIALALAGFYFVKYSIDAGWLSPIVRVTIGMMAGLGMIFAGHHIRNKPDFADGTRIAQALSGAGIADLYVCIFAATNLYNLLPSAMGFVGMAAVTAAAVILSLRHGAPIALLGLIGGFLTPALIGSAHPSAPTLFIYLYLILTGLLVVIRKQGWWPLAMLAVTASFLWVFAWLLGGSFRADDTLWLGLFLAAVSFTTIKFAHQPHLDTQKSTDIFAVTWTDSTMAGALALMGFVASKGGFGALEWSLFGLLTAGGIVMAYFDQQQYGKIPLMSLVVNAVMFMCWQFQDPQNFALTLALFAALYIVSGYLLQTRSQNPLRWAGLTAAAGLGYYLLGYFKLHGKFALDIPYFWGVLSFALAGLSIAALALISKTIPETHPQRQHLFAVFAGVATAFISIGLCVEMDREFLAVAFAGQILALAWIHTRVTINALPKIIAAVAAVFGVLLLPQIYLLMQLTAYSLVAIAPPFRPIVSLVEWPLFHLGLPALCFLGASLLLRQQKDSHLVKLFEVTAVSLAGVAGYYLLRQLLHPDQNILLIKADFAERGIITNVIFAYGLSCLLLGKQYSRAALSLCGSVLGAIAAFRIGYFDLLVSNPLWHHQNVGAVPIANALLLTYGLPVFWLSRMIKYLRHFEVKSGVKYGYAAILLLSFVLLSLEVRQLFHGAFLNMGETTNAEIYSYSVVWLLFGLGLLLFGTIRKNKTIRVVSLAVMILTVGKVFLYDASALTELYRVFSFAGLGLSLLGLSWFYTRFVFIRPNKD